MATSRKKMKHPKAIEIERAREEMQKALDSLFAPAAVFAVQLFLPQRKDVFLANMFSLVCVIVAQLFTAWVLKTTSGHANIKKIHMLSGIVHHMALTMGHVIYIATNNNDLFGRLFFLFVAPCSAARLSSHPASIGFVVTHLVLVFYRCAHTISEGFPFVITSVACIHILYDMSLLKKRVDESAIETSETLIAWTEDVAQNVLEYFCDANARMSPDATIVQDSPSLSIFLNRNVFSGRSFPDFVHRSDRERYREFIAKLNVDSVMFHRTDEGTSMEDIDIAQGLRIQPIDVHIVDNFGIPLDVHVFHVRIKAFSEFPLYLIGVSERDSYKCAKKVTPNGRRTKRTDKTRLDFESGILRSSQSVFEQGDVVAMRDLTSLQKRPERRAASPRPQNREGLAMSPWSKTPLSATPNVD